MNFAKIWFKNAKKYSEVYTDVDCFLPIVVDVDDKGIFAGFTNEATFAANFSQEMGYLTNETLHTYQNFQNYLIGSLQYNYQTSQILQNYHLE